MIYNDIIKADPKLDDVILYINSPFGGDKKSKQGILFLYKGLEDGYVVLGKDAVRLDLLPNDSRQVIFPNPKIDKSLYPDGLYRLSKKAEEIYVGLDSVIQGLVSHKEFESYGDAVAQYYANSPK